MSGFPKNKTLRIFGCNPVHSLYSHLPVSLCVSRLCLNSTSHTACGQYESSISAVNRTSLTMYRNVRFMSSTITFSSEFCGIVVRSSPPLKVIRSFTALLTYSATLSAWIILGLHPVWAVPYWMDLFIKSANCAWYLMGKTNVHREFTLVNFITYFPSIGSLSSLVRKHRWIIPTLLHSHYWCVRAYIALDCPLVTRFMSVSGRRVDWPVVLSGFQRKFVLFWCWNG